MYAAYSKHIEIYTHSSKSYVFFISTIEKVPRITSTPQQPYSCGLKLHVEKSHQYLIVVCTMIRMRMYLNALGKQIDICSCSCIVGKCRTLGDPLWATSISHHSIDKYTFECETDRNVYLIWSLTLSNVIQDMRYDSTKKFQLIFIIKTDENT